MSTPTAGKGKPQLVSAVLLLSALALAPIIGGGFRETPTAVLGILVLAGIVSHAVLSRSDEDSWSRVPGLLPLGVFLLAVLVSTVFTEAIYSSLKQLVFFAVCVGAYALAAAVCRDSRVAAAAAWGVTLSALWICLMGVRHYAISTGGGSQFWQSLMGSGDHMRLFGPFINPGFFAGFLVVALPVTMGVYLVTRRTVLALLAGTAVVTEALALMLTGTKFGIIAAVAALVVFFGLATVTRSLRRAKFWRLLGLAVVLIPLLVVFSKPVKSRISAAEAGGTQVHSTVFRAYTWQGTLGMISANLWTGVGAGAFETAYPRYTIAGPTTHAHQSYLQIAAESGIVALGALLVALVVIGRRSLRGITGGAGDSSGGSRKASDDSQPPGPSITWKDMVPFSAWRLVNCAIFAALVGSAVRSLVDSDWYVMGIALPFWVLAGVLAAQSGAARDAAKVGRTGRIAVIAVCTVLALLAGSFGLGDFLAPDRMQPVDSVSQIKGRYELASKVSPLNPIYHRELSKCLAAEGSPVGAARQIEAAIRLAPRDASNYHVRGLIALRTDDLKTARRSFLRSLEFNPNSTQTLANLAEVRRAEGDTEGFEAALRRIIEIEGSEYEQVKGAPELVDTTFADAHAYFGAKYLAERKHRRAITEFTAVVNRLERWRSNEDILRMKRVTGMITEEEEQRTLDVLHNSYLSLADVYDSLGHADLAESAREKAERVYSEEPAAGE